MYRERGERRRRRRLGRVAVHGRRLGRAAAFRRRQAAVGRRRRAAGAEQMFLFQTNKKKSRKFPFLSLCSLPSRQQELRSSQVVAETHSLSSDNRNIELEEARIY